MSAIAPVGLRASAQPAIAARRPSLAASAYARAVTLIPGPLSAKPGLAQRAAAPTLHQPHMWLQSWPDDRTAPRSSADHARLRTHRSVQDLGIPVRQLHIRRAAVGTLGRASRVSRLSGRSWLRRLDSRQRGPGRWPASHRGWPSVVDTNNGVTFSCRTFQHANALRCSLD